MSNNLSHVKVEIILPNYNSETYLEETIKSVINQTFKNWRLSIVDGNSNIATQEILKKYINYKYINIIKLKKNKKAAFCRNYAIRNAKSDYIAFIDSDDIWDKEKLSKQLDFMDKNNYHFTYTNYQPFKSNKHLSEIKPAKYFDYKKFTKNTSIATSSMIIKKSLIGNTKFSNTAICEDYFFKCQILKKVKYAYCLPENLMRYRIREGSLQSNKMRNLYWIWYINKNYNKMSFLNNLLSIFYISLSSIKRYGLK
tara:strand:- start:1636 stop:2397 length:762 start_codon:yes stop_codon:yes gene_type:complete